MYAKIKITGSLEVKTGLHIGTSGAFSAIGAVDAPVVRDALTRKPIIPGSSVKGKMRSLLARQYNNNLSKNFDLDDERILRLFGSSAQDKKHRAGRLLFTDMFLINAKELEDKGQEETTEIKFENYINRITAEATPRQIERVIRGCVFGLALIYEMHDQTEGEMIQDFETISDGFKLLTYDYIGGSGSRGYGKVEFAGLKAETVIGEIPKEAETRIGEILARVGEA